MFIMFKDLLSQQNLEEEYQSCLQIVGIGDLLGRLLAGLASSHTPFNVDPLKQYFVVHILSCLVFFSFCLTFTFSNMSCIYLLFLMFGITWGAQNLYLAVAPAAVLGVANISTVLGTFLFSAGIGQLIGKHSYIQPKSILSLRSSSVWVASRLHRQLLCCLNHGFNKSSISYNQHRHRNCYTLQKKQQSR